jgi:lipopolysaccharide/colanic/teichoic acid biosynthesis glycosyltransferase
MLRLLDLVISTSLILLLLPIFLPTMLILRFTGEGEVFYAQTRVGKGGRPIQVLKFATMLKASPNLAGGFLTQRDDPRVLPVGRVLRNWKINELPQLFNVWMGHMSLVGPRPQARVHYNLFSDEQKAAIDTQLPGVTGIGSLVFRDEEGLLDRSGMPFDEFHDHVITPFKGELERWYAHHRSLSLYFKILFLTALSLVRPRMDYLRFFPGVPEAVPELKAILGSSPAN